MDFLQVSGINKQESDSVALHDIHLTLHHLEKMAVAGETGSGKTTLLKTIGGHAQPDSGEVLFLGKRVKGLFEKLLPGHPGIAFLSQHFELRNHYWVHEILGYANELTASQATAIYRICRIEHLLQRRTDQLSGGEKQRIALARILIGSPKLLLLDEPFSNLDAVHKQAIKTVIQDISNELGITCMLVSHDAPDILSWADTIVVMKEGRIIQQATPSIIYHSPVNEYCAGLFGYYTLLHSTSVSTLLGSANQQGKLLVRPEYFSINTNGEGAAVIVQQVSFWGAYYTADVLLGEQLIRVNTGTTALHKGQPISISLSDHHRWYLY